MLLAIRGGYAQTFPLNDMIPKIVHYIWFGDNPLPPKIKKCIDSWKVYLKDYEFMLWNEETFPINQACQFVQEAYAKKQFAFVSDYVRFYALSKYGGIYLDTDVEFIKSLDEEFLKGNLVLALDDGGHISGSTIMCRPGNKFISDSQKYYESIPFINSDGTFCNEVINSHMQNRLSPFGYDAQNKIQAIVYKDEDCTLFPDEYFHVRSLTTGKLNLTKNSYCIHWHTITWVSFKTRVINFLRINLLVPILGDKLYLKIVRKLKHGKTTF